MTIANNKGIMQILPALETGGTERVAISLAIAVKKAGYQSVVVSNGGSLVRELLRADVVHIVMPVHAKNLFTLKSRARKIKQIAEKYNIEIIHAHSRVPAWIAYHATKNNNIHFMSTCHGFFKLSSALKLYYSSIVGRGARAVAVSKFIHDYLKDQLQAKAKNIRTIPLGVHLQHYHPDSVSPQRMIKLLDEWHIPEDRSIIMLPGRISRTKGQDVLIKAVALGRKDALYLIVGNYQNRMRVKQELDSLIEELGVGSQVQFTGVCRDMPAAYRICDIVVVPSTWPEPGGTVAIEAQAIGKPVIVSDIGGMAESVIDGKTGYIIEANNPQLLTDKINTLLELSERKKEKMQKQAMARMRKYFSNDLMCKRYLDVYRELLMGAPTNKELLGFPHL